MKFSSHSSTSEQGATILEFALVIGLFLFTVLAVIDFARIFSVQAILTRGAQEGLQLAKVIEGFRIDLDALAIGCPSTTGNPPVPQPACVAANYQQFLNARQQVIAAATRLPLGTFTSAPGTGSELDLQSYQMFDTPTPATPIPPGQLTNLAALVLRPTDYGVNLVTGTEIIHPQICPANLSVSCTGNKRRRALGENLSSLFRNFPILVQVEADITPFFPFLGPIHLVGRAVGYREVSSGAQSGQLPDLLTCLDPPECDPNTHDLVACECQCNVQCPPNRPVPGATCGECNCSAANCPIAGQTRDPVTCECSCPTPGPVCPPTGSAPGNYYAILPNSCACQCNTDALVGAWWNGNQPGNTPCRVDWNACTCTPCPTVLPCPADRPYHGASCECECPGWIQANCTGPGQVFDPATCTCGSCPTGIPTCPSPSFAVGCNCQCPTTSCGARKIRSPVPGCSCICAPAYTAASLNCSGETPLYDGANCRCIPDPGDVGGG